MVVARNVIILVKELVSARTVTQKYNDKRITGSIDTDLLAGKSHFNEIKLTGKCTFLQGPPHSINTSLVKFLHSGEHALNNPHFSSHRWIICKDNNLDNDSNFQVTVKTVSITIITLYTPQRQF